MRVPAIVSAVVSAVVALVIVLVLLYAVPACSPGPRPSGITPAQWQSEVVSVCQ